MGWTALPPKVRLAIEDRLGSSVVTSGTRHGGFSPGVAAVVTCADGAEYFVKAVHPDLNPVSPGMYREEARCAAALPGRVPAPRLHHVHDDDGWIALVFEAVDGAPPEVPWRAADVRRLLGTLELLTAAPVGGDLAALPTVPARLDESFRAYRRLADANADSDGSGALSDWERRHLDRLAAAAEDALEFTAGDFLVHLDLRADNIVSSRDGDYIVDWSWASAGAPWIDKVCLLVNVATYGGDPEPFVAADPVLASVPPEHVTAFLAGLSGMWAEAVAQPPPPGIPNLRAFQDLQATAVRAWIRARTGWD
ncbi:phosphotransferase [Actinomadura miaoliensis]